MYCINIYIIFSYNTEKNKSRQGISIKVKLLMDSKLIIKLKDFLKEHGITIN